MNIRTRVQQDPVASFFILYLGLNFVTLLLPVESESAFTALLTMMVIIPTLIALILVTIMDGRSGAATFLRQTFRWRSPLKWYLIALATGFAIQFGSSVGALVAGQISTLEIAAPTVFLFILIPWALMEEIGLRGFVLPRLLERHSPLTATLIVGVPWALVHFALIALHPPDGRSPLIAGLTVLVVAIPHTWVYIKSERSVLIATALHWAFNISGSIAGPARILSEAESAPFLLASTCLVTAFVMLMNWRMWVEHPAEITVDEAVLPATS